MSSSNSSPNDSIARILWQSQSVFDNYVGVDFLASLQTNPDTYRYSYKTLLLQTSVLTHRIYIVVIFLAMFIHCFHGIIRPMHLFWVNTFLLAAGFFIISFSSVLFDTSLPFLSYSTFISSVVRFCVILLSSTPVIGSLTNSFSNDTVWALTTMMLSIHILTFKYHFPDSDSRVENENEGSLLHTPRQTKIPQLIHSTPATPQPITPLSLKFFDRSQSLAGPLKNAAKNAKLSKGKRSISQQSIHPKTQTPRGIDKSQSSTSLWGTHQHHDFNTDHESSSSNEPELDPTDIFPAQLGIQEEEKDENRLESWNSSTSTISSLFATIFLASRFNSNSYVFLFTVFSVNIFVLYPSFIAVMHQKSQRYLESITTVIVVLIALVLLYPLSMAAFYVCLVSVFVIQFISPLLLKQFTKYKHTIKGPWDEAQPFEGMMLNFQN